VTSDIEGAHKELTRRVMGRPGVTGTAIGLVGGEPCLKVYLTEKGAGGSLPSTVRGFRVVREVTGSFRRL